MASADFTTFDFALKEFYTKKKVQEIWLRNNTFLDLVQKNSELQGDTYVVPVVYGINAGRSAAFATAQTNASGVDGVKFSLTVASDYAVCTVDNKTIKASKGDAGAFLRATKAQIDSSLRSLARSMATGLYGAGSGKLGKIATGGISGNVVTLDVISDISNFYKGQKLQACDTETGGTLRDSGATMTITSVDRDLGKFTCSGGLITGLAAADFLYQHGDYDAKIKGLAAWIPSTAPSSTAFFGVDRTADLTALGGVRLTATGAPIEEAVVDLVAKVERYGGQPDVVLMNPVQFRAFEKALGSKVTYSNPQAGGKGVVGFKGIEISGQHSTVKVLSDMNCPNALVYALQLDTLELASLGPCPDQFDTDGISMLRQATADGVEIRWSAYAQLSCNAPGYNGVATVDAIAQT